MNAFQSIDNKKCPYCQSGLIRIIESEINESIKNNNEIGMIHCIHYRISGYCLNCHKVLYVDPDREYRLLPYDESYIDLYNKLKSIGVV